MAKEVRKPSIGDLLILAGNAINNPEEFAREAAHAGRQEAKMFLKELIDKTFDEKPASQNKWYCQQCNIGVDDIQEHLRKFHPHIKEKRGKRAAH